MFHVCKLCSNFVSLMGAYKYLYSFLACVLVSCQGEKKQELTPWGSTLQASADSVSTDYTFNDILNNGEIIMLTLSGPQTYYEYHGRGLGTQYLLCEKFAQSIGVSLRVEVCRDTAELVKRLRNGEGDIAALPLPHFTRGVKFCGVRYPKEQTSWAVEESNTALADTLNKWFRPALITQIAKEQEFVLSTRSITRHVYSPMLDSRAGIISKYDHLFQKYAPVARVDWRLMAAQCYQESTFDPRARSWAGACGLMQIMPETADHIGVSRAQLYEPEANIAAAAKYIDQLSSRFRDVPDKKERISFVLASYNGGYHHIRDAMALTHKYGRNQHSWRDVSGYVLGLRDPHYYTDPIVKYGYMRGGETVDYVERIHARWAQYRGSASVSTFKGAYGSLEPQRATKKYRFHL